MTQPPVSLTRYLAAINTAGVVGVLVTVIWLGLSGSVVTAEQYRQCAVARDTYLQEWLRAIARAPAPAVFVVPDSEPAWQPGATIGVTIPIWGQ